jgi:hypothetical protein
MDADKKIFFLKIFRKYLSGTEVLLSSSSSFKEQNYFHK